jgi:hypothetical protein
MADSPFSFRRLIMSVALPKPRVGDPVRHEGLSVFPLFLEASGEIGYRLSDEALADQSVLVEEVGQSGSVPDLLVENKGDLRVLFLEGEELVGAKQNRVLNTSVLIAAHTKIKIPVSCVEQGRWRYKSRYFGSSGSHSPSKLRRSLKASVSRSLKEKRGHTSDQGEVWKEVASLHSTHGVESGTGAMSDAFDAYQDRIASFREKLPYVEGAAGVAVAIGARVVSLDLFDKPSTCRKVWDRLLSGVVFDALEAESAERNASVADVEQLLAAAGDLPWEQAETVGEGEEYRAESKQGDHASALVFEGAVVHGNVLTAV